MPLASLETLLSDFLKVPLKIINGQKGLFLNTKFAPLFVVGL